MTERVTPERRPSEQRRRLLQFPHAFFHRAHGHDAQLIPLREAALFQELVDVLRALGPSLHAFPSLNASLDDEKQEIVLKKRIHIAVAVAAPDGLTVPVVQDADKLGLFDLAREVGRLADAARTNALKPEELSGATFTVTTTGAKGGVLATPLVHHPQVAILGIHAVTPRPVVRDGEIVILRMVNLSLSLDHRVVDGQQGADFLYDVIARLESPLEGWL